MSLILNRILPDNATILDVAMTLPPAGWTEVFLKSEEELRHISSVLSQMDPPDFYPLKTEMFAAFDFCPLANVKVVILGQDPYTGTDNGLPEANGMAFSTRRGQKLQPSLRNIYKELSTEYPDFISPDHGDLTEWAIQGVLLLNTCLTVTPSKPGSHKEIWNGFIGRVIDAISTVNPDCVFILMGGKAQKWVPKISQKSLKLCTTHPALYGSFKGSRDSVYFAESRVFSQVNAKLVELKKEPIRWQLSL